MGTGTVNSIPGSAQNLLLSLSQLWAKKGKRGKEDARKALGRCDIISIRQTDKCLWSIYAVLSLGSRGKIKQMWFLTS